MSACVKRELRTWTRTVAGSCELSPDRLRTWARGRTRALRAVTFLAVLGIAGVRSGSLRAALPPADRADPIAELRALGASIRVLDDGAPATPLEVEFHVRGRNLDDEGLARLAALDASFLRRIVSLSLRDTKVTDRGLVHLSKLSSLRRLHLERTAVGDEGLKHLAALRKLEYLNLYGTRVTDAGLQHLKSLKKLRRLYVWNTKVTRDGAEVLKKALPHLKVVFGLDLSKIEPISFDKPEPPKPKEDLVWMPVAAREDVPKSLNGINTTVIFVNKSGIHVKVYWVSYGNELKLYGELDPGEMRVQNTYARNTWLITDKDDRPLGYFRVGEEVARAVIPKLPQASK